MSDVDDEMRCEAYTADMHAPIRLSERDQRVFVDALVAPPAPNSRLRELFDKSKSVPVQNRTAHANTHE